MAPVRLIANWAMTAARTAVSAVSEMVGMTAAAQTGAKTISAPKTSAKEVSPTSRTSDEAPLTLSEKNILNIIAVRLKTEQIQLAADCVFFECGSGFGKCLGHRHFLEDEIGRAHV